MSQLDALLAAIATSPDLPGARCAGRWQIWDETDDPEIVEYAIHQCNSCPCLTACAQYVDRLKPSRRPPGVVAGRVNQPRAPVRSRKATAS
jgi:hypothetical protein